VTLTPQTTVLVVDDEESVATTIKAILKMDGHDVTAVTSGTEALRLLNERQYDVVLTDLRLGDMDGVDILKEVQRTSPDTAAIMLTGYASLRTPLTAVSGFIQVARRRITRAAENDAGVDWKHEATRAAETLELAQRQSRRLGRLVDELLDVSRLQLGRIELHQRELDLVHCLREVVERMKLLQTSHAFELQTVAEKAVVLADQDRIDQVFENVIGNAVKYSPAGGTIKVEIRVDGSEVQVSISDRGIGISPDELEHVFNIFYRSPDPRAGHVGGLGLGLYISREIVTRHDGRLWAESGTDGSTFRVALPLATDPTPDAVTTPAAASRG